MDSNFLLVSIFVCLNHIHCFRQFKDDQRHWFLCIQGTQMLGHFHVPLQMYIQWFVDSQQNISMICILGSGMTESSCLECFSVLLTQVNLVPNITSLHKYSLNTPQHNCLQQQCIILGQVRLDTPKHWHVLPTGLFSNRNPLPWVRLG